MLSPCQQFINSIELWAVPHVLMDFLDVGQDTVKEKKPLLGFVILDVETVRNRILEVCLDQITFYFSPFSPLFLKNDI